MCVCHFLYFCVEHFLSNCSWSVRVSKWTVSHNSHLLCICSFIQKNLTYTHVNKCKEFWFSDNFFSENVKISYMFQQFICTFVIFLYFRVEHFLSNCSWSVRVSKWTVSHNSHLSCICSSIQKILTYINKWRVLFWKIWPI